MRKKDSMGRRRSRSIHQISIFLSYLGYFLLASGVIIGWCVPWVGKSVSLLQFFSTPLSILGKNVDINAFLGADITALAVIIAVLIGYNASTLQIAGQILSPAIVRAIMLSLAPFLICWSITTGVALIYFLIPPTFVAQLLQLLIWFGAVVLLMIGYLWSLSWRLSGEYAALWSIRELQKKPMNQWESTDGYSVLQTGVAAAAARADLATVRTMTMAIGRFLASSQDHYGEVVNHFDRERYRALKNLLSGCSQNAASAPNAVAYYLGFAAAGVLLQGVAVGNAHDAEHDLFSGLFRALRNAPERLDPLWTGLRHGLCRKGLHGDAYLLQFWRYHRSREADDPYGVRVIAEMLIHFHMYCWREAGISFNREKYAFTTGRNTGGASAAHPIQFSSEEVSIEAIGMLADLYRDIAKYLAQEVTSPGIDHLTLHDLPMQLLDTTHALVLQMWPAGETGNFRPALIKTYDGWRAEITTALRGDNFQHPISQA